MEQIELLDIEEPSVLDLIHKDIGLVAINLDISFEELTSELAQ